MRPPTAPPLLRLYRRSPGADHGRVGNVGFWGISGERRATGRAAVPSDETVTAPARSLLPRPDPRRLRAVAAVLAFGLGVTACSGAGRATRDAANPASPGAPGATTVAPSRSAAPLTPLARRVRADVLVVAAKGIPATEVSKLAKLAPGGFTTVRIGTVEISGRRLEAVAVDPARFRAFTPQGTAEATPVWQAVARGEMVVEHDVAKALRLPLGDHVIVTGGVPTTLRVGALATTGLPHADVIVSLAVGDHLGAFTGTGAVLSSGTQDPTRLAAAVRGVVGTVPRIDLLSEPEGGQLAFLSGGRAARKFGAFSYRYHADGTIEPDARWVRANIVSARIPILGSVLCHRLMVPQLRAAFTEIQRAGLGGTIRHRDYGGCYVPRFIERNPSRSVSLHTWGIAIDLNVATNGVGTAGDIDRRIVAIFEKWGFRWGGRWAEPDPMHFELGALLKL